MKQSKQQRRNVKRKKNFTKGISHGVSKYSQKKEKIVQNGKAPAGSPFTIFEVEVEKE